MKTLITASILALGLFAGTANAAPAVFDDIAATAPKAGAFEDLNMVAPRSGVFGDLNATAPHSGVFGDLQESAPRSDGVYGSIETSAP
jgi:hypothetical protein